MKKITWILSVCLLAMLLVCTVAVTGCNQVPEYETTDTPETTVAPETTEAPADETTAAPADETSAAPADETTAAPADETTAAPADETTAAPADETTAAPVDETTAAPADETTAAPVDETTAAPADETTEASADETTAAPADETTAAPADETTATPETTAEPEVETLPVEKSIELGKFVGTTDPHNTQGAVPLGQKFTVEDGYVLKQLTIIKLATFCDNVNTWTIKFWQWNTSYSATVASTPVYELSGSNHLDSINFVVNIPTSLMLTGEIYYEIRYTSGQTAFTPWVAGATVDGLVTYQNGRVSSKHFASSIAVLRTDKVGDEADETEEIVEPTEPVEQTIFNGRYHANVDYINNAGPNGTANYSGLGADSSNVGYIPVIDAAADGKVATDHIISISGWMVVNGGIHAYGYTINNGPLIVDGGAGRDGEPLDGLYAQFGATANGTLKNGIFHGQDSVYADLYDYAGRTVTVTFYAIPEQNQNTVAPIVIITNLAVPARVHEEITSGETETESTPIVDVPVGETLNAPHATQFTVSNVFSSDMVVQRGEFIRVWGWADSSQNGKKVTGEFMGMFAEAIIENGAWEITFTARLEASAQLGNTMRIYGDGVSYSFNNVLVGDVYMVIGQSNVAYGVDYHYQFSSNPSINTLDYSAPIRLHCSNINPSVDYDGKGSGVNSDEVRFGAYWKKADSYNNIYDFSALAYFFALNYAKLTENNVPIGLIEIAASGEPLGAFMSNEAAEATGSDTYNGRYMTSGVNGQSPARYIYNDYMYPFERYAMAGIIWYQGESDLGTANAMTYVEKFTALIEHMRSTHNLVNKNFPVYFVEFPTIFEKPAGYTGEWHYLDVGLIRAVMGEIQRVLPNTYQIVSTDLWDDNTLANNLHPNCKFEQGERLATLVAAVNGEAGKTLVEGNGPVLVSMEILEGGKKAILTYENVGTGLTTTDGGTSVTGFQLISRIYRVDSATTVTATITAPNQITIEATSEITGIVYNAVTTNVYGEDLNLCNSEGVPAGATLMFKE